MDLQRQAASALERHRRVIADTVTQRHFEAHPGLDARYGAAGRAKCREDTEHHLVYLQQAVAASCPEIFADYTEWAASMLESRGVPEADLTDHLATLAAVLRATLPAEQMTVIEAIIAPPLQPTPAGPPAHTAPESAPAHDFLDVLRSRGPRAAREHVSEAMRAGLSLQEIYVDVIQPCLHEIGRLWQLNQITVADEHYLTAAIQVVLAELYTSLFAQAPTRASVVIACVPGELHEIGPRMVADVLQLEGYDTHYLGANTPAAALVEFVSAKRAAVLGLSTSRAANLSHIENTVRAVRADARTRDVKIIVGGLPFLRIAALWRTVGADASASDARQAIPVVNSLVD